jgi:hypothetical protein
MGAGAGPRLPHELTGTLPGCLSSNPDGHASARPHELMILNRRLMKAVALFVPLAVCSITGPAESRQGDDLDRFMAQVLARRDDNWRKLRQYVLDEHETADFLGPGHVRLFAMDREYTWYIRDGIFVRSPVKFDGIALSEQDRRKAEQEWIEQERSREREKSKEQSEPAKAEQPRADASSRPSVDTLIQATREPQFISAAYFMRFKFEPGHYAYVGPETYEGRKVLRIEYYPSRLYDDEGPGHQAEQGEAGKKEDRITRQMNKVALVTLWIEPTEHQIVQYKFDNLALNFLPGRSIARVNGFGATMRMGQPFPGVWLPQGIDASGGFTLASGTFDAHYTVKYFNYREANTQVKIR